MSEKIRVKFSRCEGSVTVEVLNPPAREKGTGAYLLDATQVIIGAPCTTIAPGCLALGFDFGWSSIASCSYNSAEDAKEDVEEFCRLIRKINEEVYRDPEITIAE